MSNLHVIPQYAIMLATKLWSMLLNITSNIIWCFTHCLINFISLRWCHLDYMIMLSQQITTELHFYFTENCIISSCVSTVISWVNNNMKEKQCCYLQGAYGMKDTGSVRGWRPRHYQLHRVKGQKLRYFKTTWHGEIKSKSNCTFSPFIALVVQEELSKLWEGMMTRKPPFCIEGFCNRFEDVLTWLEVANTKQNQFHFLQDISHLFIVLTRRNKGFKLWVGMRTKQWQLLWRGAAINWNAIRR